jgi:small-conductance mechanosensitive channel/CRP-like cAMP-binding protein
VELILEYSSNIIQILGFFLVLGGITLILVRMAYVFAKGNIQRLRLGLEILLILSVIYWFSGPASTFTGLETGLAEFTNAIAFLWAINVAFLINAMMNQFIWGGLLSNHGDRRVPKLITDGVGLLVYALAIMLVLHYVYGEPIGAVLATSGAAAVVIGFGAQSTIREVFSGVALNATKALRIGDFVEIDGIYGQVHDINWRSVSIMNPHTNSLYIFPNSAVAEQTILNFSEPTELFRYYVKFSVELSAPPELVIRSIAEELENSRYVFRDPKPNFNMLGYSEHGIDYRVRFHFDGDDPWWDAQNEIIMAIWSAMRKQGLRISVNRMLHSAPEEWPAIDERVRDRTQFKDVQAAVAHHPVLGMLSDDEVITLCKSYRTIDLSPPSCYYQRATPCEGVFLLLEGQVDIFDITDDGDELKIDSFKPGDLFGVNAAIANSTHRFTAQASQYSITVCFPRENIEGLLLSNKKLSNSLNKLIDQQNNDREKSRNAAMKALSFAQHQKQHHTMRDELRRGLADLLQKPTLHHLLDHFSSSVRNEELAEGIMAGAAMIASARGVKDFTETDYLMSALRETDLLRHLDVNHCLELFDKYMDMLIEGHPEDESRVMQALMEATRVKNGSKIVFTICKGLCGIHTVPTTAELEALNKVAKALGEEVGPE